MIKSKGDVVMSENDCIQGDVMSENIAMSKRDYKLGDLVVVTQPSRLFDLGVVKVGEVYRVSALDRGLDGITINLPTIHGGWFMRFNQIAPACGLAKVLYGSRE